ncbi:MAG TPA: hypothetical protein VJ885_12105 [Thermoanaerobaculia bacterium]|nr:hypothetical protein [Thermoanaerobaculia bacterium]
MRQARSDHRFLVPTVSLALLLIVSAGSASAADRDRERESRREIKVERVVKLQPRAEAEVVVRDFKALFLTDGSVTVTGKGTVRAEAPPQGFDFEVDLARGTYTTRRLDQHEIEERDRLRESTRENQGGEPLEPAIKAITPGTWFGRVRVQTKDPVFVVLTETMSSLTWTTSSTGTVTGSSPSTDSCWAANPSSLDTHWFTSSCAYGGLYASSGRVCNDNTGSYYNYDFGDDADITTVSQYVYLCGRNDAMYDYSFTHNDGGEAALLIYGSVVTG